MVENDPGSAGIDRLPAEIADRFTEPFARFLRIESTNGAMLLVATATAVILANTAISDAYLSFWETSAGIRIGPFTFIRSLRGWVNDGLMTIFFFVVALELKRELVLGELRRWRVATLSLAGALGGMLVPAIVYRLLIGDHPGGHGWGTVMATDTAFVVGCLAVLGARVPGSLRLFLLSLAIFDDVGAIAVVAVGYGETLQWPALTAAFGVVGVIVFAARVGIRSMPTYVLLGVGLWICVDTSGVHPTVTGMVLGLLTPARSWVADERLRSILARVLAYPRGEHWSGTTPDRTDLLRAGVATTETLSPVERLDLILHPWSGFVVMPLFALANAGVTFSPATFWEPVSIAVFVGFVFGKPLGVFASTLTAVGLGLAHRPADLRWSLIAAGSVLTGIGFAMSLFIAGLAFDEPLLTAAKIGTFAASSVCAVGGVLALVLLTTARQRRKHGLQTVVDAA